MTAGHGPVGAELVNDLLTLQNAERLLAWAEQLTQTHTQWSQEREAFLRNHQARVFEAERQRASLHVWLDPLPSLLQATDNKHMESLAISLVEAKRTLAKEQQSANRDCEYLEEEAMLRRHRLARCRLSRREERLQEQSARAEREAEQRAQDERARLERDRARADRRRADLELERMRLQASLEKDRALFRPPRAEASVQTLAVQVATASADKVAERESSEEFYSSDSFSEDEFDEESDDDDETDEIFSHSDAHGSGSAAAIGPTAYTEPQGELSSSIGTSITSDIDSHSRGSQPSSVSQAAPAAQQRAEPRRSESFSGVSSGLSGTPESQSAHRPKAESLASIESSMSEDIAGSIASSIKSVGSDG